MAYDRKFRERAIAFKESGATFVQLKATFGIDRKTFLAWTKLRDETGEVTPIRPPQERRRKIDKEKLRQAVLEKPDAYLEELAKPFKCSVPAVFYALKKMGITLKKRRSHMLKYQKKSGFTSTRAA
ncbi:MAG: IS630 transposase-related protein [Planctomycetia bacterium]|nr:IS630 transposase-related protein [Planctomycetia bacterium]